MPADYEVSAVYLNELISITREAGHLEAVLAKVSDGARAVVASPWAENWHPAVYLEELGGAIVDVAGKWFFADIAYRNLKNKFGNIVLPMMRKTLASGTASPVLLLGNLDTSVKVAMRGFEIVWESTGEKAGTLLIIYPRPVAEHVDYSWRGVFRFIFEVFKTECTVVSFEQLEEGRVVKYTLTWK